MTNIQFGILAVAACLAAASVIGGFRWWSRGGYTARRDPMPAYHYVLGVSDPATAWRKLRARHRAWSRDAFGPVGPRGPLRHLAKEAAEVAAAPGDAAEWADLRFLLWDIQARAEVEDHEIDALRVPGLVSEIVAPEADLGAILARLAHEASAAAEARPQPSPRVILRLQELAETALARFGPPPSALLAAAIQKMAENEARAWPEARDGEPCHHIKGSTP